MNYYAVLPEAFAQNFMMKFTLRPGEGDLEIQMWESCRVTEDGQFYFAFGRIPPQCMKDSINAELFFVTDDGAQIKVDAEENYSIAQYCQKVLASNPENKDLEKMIADLIAYGVAAQHYANYKEDQLVSEGFEHLTPSEWTDVESTDKFVSEKLNEDVCFTAMGVRFGYVNKVYFKFKTPTLENMNITVTANGRDVEFLLEEVSEGVYIIYTDALYATELDTVFTVTLVVGDVEVQYMTYSAKSYVYSQQSKNTEMAALAKALYNYGRTATWYLATTQQ
jgi:hypothetical protein